MPNPARNLAAAIKIHIQLGNDRDRVCLLGVFYLHCPPPDFSARRADNSVGSFGIHRPGLHFANRFVENMVHFVHVHRSLHHKRWESVNVYRSA